MLPHCLFIVFFYLVRFAFENDKPLYWRVLFDVWLDLVYLVDMVREFTSPYLNEQSKLVYNKKLIALRYLKTWFIFDAYAFYPLGLLRYNSDWKAGSHDNLQNFWQQNYQRMPRLYKFMLLAQATRARFAPEYLSAVLKHLELRMETRNVLETFLRLALILHVAGCFWMAVTEANLDSFQNWICGNGLQDANMYVQYIASIYWATVTCTTVGYGDILPTNYYELGWAMVIIVVGVAVFSYILSNLSS